MSNARRISALALLAVAGMLAWSPVMSVPCASAQPQQGQPILVSPPFLNRVPVGQVVEQPDNVLRIPYELWGRSWYVPDGARVTLVGAPEFYASNGLSGTACVVYIERQEYPVLRLYIGEGGDNRPDDATIELRTSQWINGLLWCRSQKKTGAVIDWVPRDGNGDPVDVASWGYPLNN